MSEQFTTETHFKDLIDTSHLVQNGERLPGSDGTPGTGMKITEAVPLAEHWWETTGRYQMPDYGKPSEQCLVRSGVYMGLPWINLTKQEMLRVLAQWYANIGVHTIIEGKSTSQDGDLKDLDKLRDDAKDILPVLDTASTHAKTALGVDDTKEVETWDEEYEAIRKEEILVDAKGNTLKGKANGNQKENTKES